MYLVLRLLQVPTRPEGEAKAVADFGFIFSASQLLCQPQSWKGVRVREGPKGEGALAAEWSTSASGARWAVGLGGLGLQGSGSASHGAAERWDAELGSASAGRLLWQSNQHQSEVPQQDRHLHGPRSP